MSGRYRPGPLLPVHDYITTTRNVYSAFHQLHASRFCIIFQGDEANDLRGISAWRLDILDISNRISIDRFFKYRMVDGDYLFLLFLSSVCEYGNEGFFRFGIVVERPEIFFLSRIFCEKFTVNLFCSFVCMGNEFFSFFLFVQWKASVKRVASRFMEFFFLVFE